MRSHTHGRENKSLGRSRVTHKEALTWNNQYVAHPEYVTPPAQDTVTTQTTGSQFEVNHRTRFAPRPTSRKGLLDKPYYLTTTIQHSSQLHSKHDAVCRGKVISVLIKKISTRRGTRYDTEDPCYQYYK